jgi:large subunit ribosomal protein L25
MKTVEITVTKRDGHGKGPARRLRTSGRVPAVLYGRKRTAAHVAVRAEELDAKLAHLEGSHLIRLLGGGDADLNDRMVLLRELQRHPVSGALLHADFYEVDLTERLTVSVTLHFVGKARGVVDGGILQPILREIEVKCLPTEIPDFLEIDVTPLGIHETLRVSDLALPQGATAVTDATQTIVSVLPPTVEAKPVEAAAAEGAVPAEGAAAAPGAAPAGAPGAAPGAAPAAPAKAPAGRKGE